MERDKKVEYYRRFKAEFIAQLCTANNLDIDELDDKEARVQALADLPVVRDPMAEALQAGGKTDIESMVKSFNEALVEFRTALAEKN